MYDLLSDTYWPPEPPRPLPNLNLESQFWLDTDMQMYVKELLANVDNCVPVSVFHWTPTQYKD